MEVPCAQETKLKGNKARNLGVKKAGRRVPGVSSGQTKDKKKKIVVE